MDKLKKIFRDRSRSRSRRSSGETRRSHDVARTSDADTPVSSVQRSAVSSPDDASPSPSANRGRANSAARKPLPPNSKARISLEQDSYARNTAAAYDASPQSSHSTKLPIAEEFTSTSRYAPAPPRVTSLGNAFPTDGNATSPRLNGDVAPILSGHETTLPIRNPKTRTDLTSDTPVNNFSRKSVDTSRNTSLATSRVASGQQFDGKYDREAAYTPNLTSGEIPVSPSGIHARNVSTGTHARNVSTGAASIDKPLPTTPSTTTKAVPQTAPSHFGPHGGEPVPGHLAPSLVIPKQYEYNVVRPGPQQLYTQPYVVEKAASKPSLAGIVDLTNTTDTTVEERWAPTVVHEVVFPHQHNIREERITREFHNHHIHHRMQPVIDVRVLPSFHFAATPDGRLERIPTPVGSLAGRTPNWVIAETVSRHDTAFHPGRAAPPAITSGHNVDPHHPTAGWPRPFTARTFAPGEGDHKEYLNEHGVLTTETTWIHPPRLAQAAYHAGETLPLDFHVPSGREREVAGYLETAP